MRKVFAPFIGTLIGIVVGFSIVKIFLPLFIKWQLGEYNYSVNYIRIAILAICVALNLAIFYTFFQRVTSVSITTIIFSAVSQAQILLHIKEKSIATPEIISFITIIGMVFVGIIVSVAYRNSYNEMVGKNVKELCNKHDRMSKFMNIITEITKEVKPPSIWMVFDKKYVCKIKNLLRTYSESVADKQEFIKDVDSLRFEMKGLYRMWVTTVLAFAASICAYCVGFQAVPITTP